LFWLAGALAEECWQSLPRQMHPQRKQVNTHCSKKTLDISVHLITKKSD